jgi:hypothetical protein
MKLKLYNILLEQTELFEIAQKIIDKLIEKFKIEEPSASDENIKYYIDEFEKRKGNPSITKKDIQTYTFKELEKVIDSLPTNQKISKSDNNVEFSNTELIYNQTPLQIYHGSNEKTCIKIKGDFPSSWCVSRSRGGNMYNTYRYAGTEPSFYFVKNLDRLNKITEIEEDLFCFFVIQFNNKGEYIVTNAKNDGDEPMTWKKILKLEPLLQGKEGLFQNVPLTDEEKEYYRRFKNGIPDDEYRDLSYKEKKIYIAIKHDLNYNQFINTPKDLINDYITTGVELTQEQFDFIKDKQSLVNNYRRVTIDIVIPEYIKGNVNFNSRWLVLTNEETIDLYNKKEVNLPEILKYKPQLIDYFKDKDKILYELRGSGIIEILSKHPQLFDKFEFLLNRLTTKDISIILSRQPQLIGKFEDKLKDLRLDDIVSILLIQPQLIEKFENRISGCSIDDATLILSKQPQLIEKIENRLDSLYPNQIVYILSKQPSLIEKFENVLNKLYYNEIDEILEKQPQLKPYFEKFLDRLDRLYDDDEINEILEKQPQLKPINENRKLKLYNILLEQTELFEIAQKIKDRVFEKFKIEEPRVSDDIIKYYIGEFEKRQGNPSITKKDIQTYTFKELEKVIDSLPTNQKISKSDNNVEFSNTELIYNQSPLQIYHGSNEKTCIKIKGDFPSSWCVSRSAGGNMYNTYRYAGTEPSFYFVKNLDRLNKITEIEEDLFCFFVIQFNNKGKYIVTNAKNDGDREMSWEEILKLEPLLQGKESLFKNVPLTR